MRRAAAAAAAVAAAAPRASSGSGAPAAAVFGGAGQQVRIEAWGDDSLRIRAVPSGASFSDSAFGALLPRAAPAAEARAGGGPVRSGNIEAEVDGAGRIVVTRVSDGAKLLSETSPRTMSPVAADAADARYSAAPLYHVTAGMPLQSGERVYGLGQHGHGSLDQVGKGMGFFQANTEVFIPFAVSSRGYGYLVNFPGGGNVAWSGNTAEWTLQAAAQYDVWVTCAAAGAEAAWPAQVAAHYANATGHSPVLPEWATGLWQSKNRYQTQQQILDVVQGYRDRNLPLSVIVADYFTWSPQYNTGDYDMDPTCWPDPAALIKQLREWGVELMISTYGNFVSPKSGNYAAAKKAGLFATDQSGDVITNGFQNSAVYDFYNPKAREHFWADFKKHYVDKYGIKVFWQDCDEWCSDSGGSSSKAYYPSVGSAAAVGSAYPGVLAQAWHEGLQGSGVPDGIQLGRSAWAGTQRFGHATWSGDIGSTWGSLAMSIPAGQSIGVSGIPWWTTDVGGYGGSHGRAMDCDDPNARELMVRWVQFGAFCPLFRIHGFRAPNMSTAHTCPVCVSYSCDQSHETAAWAYGSEAEAAIGKMILAREALRPYINKMMAVAADTGAPFMRPLWFEFPDDAKTMTAAVETTQFMAGDTYLVAPVTEYKARSREVYFPAGARWKHHFTGDEYPGGASASVATPYDTPAVFERVGAGPAPAPPPQPPQPTPAPPSPSADGVTLHEAGGSGRLFLPRTGFAKNTNRGGALAWDVCGGGNFDNGHPLWTQGVGSFVGAFEVSGGWGVRTSTKCGLRYSYDPLPMGGKTYTAADGRVAFDDGAYLEQA